MHTENQISTRAEIIALCGAWLQLLIGGGLAVLAWQSSETVAFGVLAIYVAIGAGFFLTAWAHLRCQRLTISEKNDREILEQTRAAQGLSSLFSVDEISPAQRNLQQMNNYFAPALSFLLAIFLLAPSIYLWRQFANFADEIFVNLPISITPVFGVLPLLSAFLLFVLGKYSAGLCRVDVWRNLRAGAGYALSSAILTGVFGAAILLGFKLSFYPVRVIMLLTILWSLLQAVEIFLNVILDHYRPQIATAKIRPAYDSRMSGLLAEPASVLATFAQALDYQFGFKVSQTWFFRFVEKSIMPLMLIMALSFYALSCIVVIAPGQAVIIERFGAPRGWQHYHAQNNHEFDWDEFARLYPPLKNGIYFKYPYPFEIAHYVAQEKPTPLTFGFDKLKSPTATTANWDVIHQTDEHQYLMPLSTRNPRDNNLDLMLIAGEFIVEYRLDSDAEVYRFLYHYQHSEPMLKALVERELTCYLAGEDFWRVLTAVGENQTQKKIAAHLSAIIKREKLGVAISGLTIANLHPPAGETGKAFLTVTASWQQQKTEITRGEISARQILGLAPAQALTITNDAKAYSNERLRLSAANRDWFKYQLQAEKIAPSIFRTQKQMQVLETALPKTQKILLPENTTLIMDDSKTADPDSVNNIMARELNKLNAR